MKKIVLTIDDELDGKQIKYILRNHMSISASLVKQLKYTSDGILLNGKTAFVNRSVSLGDELVLTLRDCVSENIEPKNIPLDILYEDEDIIALNKPRAMPTHPSLNHHDDTLANGVMYYFRDVEFTFRVITRLDKDTSGVVLVAKNALAAQRLGDDIKSKKIKKKYIAVLCTVPLRLKGTIDAPIKRVDGSAILRCTSPDGKDAFTEYKVVAQKNGLALAELVPHTGRTHQLRVHMSSVGAPIYGDDMYGAPQKNEKTRLHCARLEFIHPVSGCPIIIEAPVPEDMAKLFK